MDDLANELLDALGMNPKGMEDRLRQSGKLNELTKRFSGAEDRERILTDIQENFGMKAQEVFGGVLRREMGKKDEGEE